MMLKDYPIFTPLDIDMKAVFDNAFMASPPEISEYTFTNLYAWKNTYKFEACLLDGSIIITSLKDQTQHFFPPIGGKNTFGTMEKLLLGSGGVFIRAPEPIKALFEKNTRFIITPDRNNSDYIFDAGSLAALKGRKYDGKRNLIKNFESKHEYEYVKLGPSNIENVLAFEKTWCDIKDCDSVEGLSNERNALKEMVKHFSDFHLIGSAIKVNSAIKAVAIGEALNPDTFVIHILKAEQSLAGLYQVMCREFISRECLGYKYINMEQDLGAEGLRRSKSSYHPIRMIDKFTIGLKA